MDQGIMNIDKKEAGQTRRMQSMEKGVGISFPELFIKAVFCWWGEGKESGEAEGLRPQQSYIFYIE